MNSVTKPFLIRTIKFIIFWFLIGGLIYLIGHFIYLFIPFILAFILTAMINPLKRFFVRKLNFPLGLAVLTAMIIEVGSFGAAIIFLVLRLIQEIQEIYLHWPHYSRFVRHVFAHWLNTVETVYLNLPGNYTATINGAMAKMFNSVSAVLTWGVRMTATVPEIIIIIVIALVATYFMAKGSERYISQFVRIFPVEWQKNVIELGRDFSRAFVGFVKAEFVVFVVIILCSILGLLFLKVKYALILGTITGIFGVLPVLGVGIILVPWAFLAFLTGHTLFAIELLLLTTIVSILRHVIEPKILGDNVGLDPLFVLMSIYIGLAATGAIGLILGPFVLIAYSSLHKAGIFRNL